MASVVAGWLLPALERQQPLPSAAAAVHSLQGVRADSYCMMRRHGPRAASLKLPSGVGSTSLPERAMSARAKHTLLTCRLRLVRSRGRILPGPSPPCRPMRPSSSPVPTSASCVRLPLPLAPRFCRCRGRLDPLGDHPRALPLEHAVIRVCREAGAARGCPQVVGDMNTDVPVVDDRRIEVVAKGLPLWHGAQLAVDATPVSPLTRAREPQTRADVGA